MLEQLKISTPIESILEYQNEFLCTKNIDERKKLGQYFTGLPVSQYMASLLNKPKNRYVRILDAGAGTGILTATTALHCLDMGCKKVHAVLYEIDKNAHYNLKQTLKIVQDIYVRHHADFTYEIQSKDFVLSRPDKDINIEPFDIAVINPPYFKYSVQSSHYSKVVADLYRGDPNIYASFMAIVIACLNKGGQMVSITPRSFTNGLYFKGFRNYLLTESSLDIIHIFNHRDKVFKTENTSVLQENIICRFIKGKKNKLIAVRTSDCDSEITSSSEQKYPVDLIIDRTNDQKIIRIPSSSYEGNILKQAETLKTTFDRAGYFISTGPIVEHRTRDYIKYGSRNKNTVPLYRPHNITSLKVTWSGKHKKDVSFTLKRDHDKHTINNATYVLLKRFSSKDEKRRLVAGVYFDNFHKCEVIGFGNKVNYIGRKSGKFTKAEAFGIAALFNSSFMDKYFRCISGNTQVNATEIRIMKFPTREQVKEIGKLAQKLKNVETSKIDSIVNPILGVMEVI